MYSHHLTDKPDDTSGGHLFIIRGLPANLQKIPLCLSNPPLPLPSSNTTHNFCIQLIKRAKLSSYSSRASIIYLSQFGTLTPCKDLFIWLCDGELQSCLPADPQRLQLCKIFIEVSSCAFVWICLPSFYRFDLFVVPLFVVNSDCQ